MTSRTQTSLADHVLCVFVFPDQGSSFLIFFFPTTPLAEVLFKQIGEVWRGKEGILEDTSFIDLLGCGFLILRIVFWGYVYRKPRFLKYDLSWGLTNDVSIHVKNINMYLYCHFALVCLNFHFLFVFISVVGRIKALRYIHILFLKIYALLSLHDKREIADVIILNYLWGLIKSKGIYYRRESEI